MSSSSTKIPLQNKTITNLANSISNSSKKPSKIPKYQRNSSHSNANSVTSSANDLNFSLTSSSSSKIKYLSSNSKIPQRQLKQTSETTTASPNINCNAYVKTTTKTLINSTTFISKKNLNGEERVVIKDEGYSTMSNELVNKIHFNNTNNYKNLSTSGSNIVTMSCGSTSSTSQAWVREKCFI